MRRALLSVSLALFACAEPATSPTPDMSPEPPAVTFHRDVRPIFAVHCEGCHASGGVGPFALDTYDEAFALKDLIAMSVTSGAMPPWQPDPDCRPLRGDRRLSDDDKQTILDWAQGDAAAGDLDDAPSLELPEPRTLPDPQIKSIPGQGFVPDATRLDDYRCFVLPETFDQETFVTGYDIRPGEGGLVHHAALFMALPGSEGTLEDLEAAEPEQPGYTCFGDPKLQTVEYFGGWIPGSGAVLFPEDTAYVIPPGGRVILQVHYNLATATAVADATEVQMITRPDPPQKRVRQQPLPDLGIVIAPGDAASSHTTLHAHKGSDAWEAIGVLPHMHLLGRKLSVTVKRPDDTQACLLRIEDWDFNWQESYFFEEALMIESGDELELNCTYDNSPANQPMVSGSPRAPQEVRWGDGTFDEMCVGVVTTLVPYVPPAPPVPGCAQPGTPGNELGVGKYCANLRDCRGQDASFCLTPFSPGTNICTITGCETDADCGQDATCNRGDGGSACISNACR